MTQQHEKFLTKQVKTIDKGKDKVKQILRDSFQTVGGNHH
jgi:hypothetical protein